MDRVWGVANWSPSAFPRRRHGPITERYFLGGANTVRGYDERELGPKDRSNASIGGEGFLAFNLETRRPIYKALHAVVFLDAGQLYKTGPSDIWPHALLETWNDLQYAAGTGIRWHTPLGALRFESGYALTPPGVAPFGTDGR